MEWVNWIFGILYFLLIISTVVSVMLDNHEPAETIAWIIAIVAIPGLGLLLYYFFGQNIRRKRVIGKRSVDLLTRKIMSKYVSQESYYKEDDEDVALIRFFKRHGMALPFGGNRGQYYTYGREWLIDLLRDIGRARHHVHLEFFIIENDPVGQLVKDALLDAVKRGVRVRLIYDDVGCWSVRKRFFREMADGGIEVESFMPVHVPVLAHRVNYRNHRKLVIIDGRTGYIGGMNLALRYVRGVHGGEWRDLQMRLQGGGVWAMQLLFLADWYVACKQMITDPVYYPDVGKWPSQEGALIQIVQSAPFSAWPNLLMGFNKVIQSARRYILLQTPYFMPTASLISSLQTAAMSGVKVQLMVPKRPGGFWMTWANESYFGDMLRAGVEVLLYTPGMLHAKLIVVDDHFVSVGSATLDFRSMLDTFEDSALIYDDEMALRAKALYKEAKLKCERINLQRWNKRNLRRRLIESFVRIFSPMF